MIGVSRGQGALLLALSVSVLAVAEPSLPAVAPSAWPSPLAPAFCGLVARCGLKTPNVCAAEHAGGIAGVEYDLERCREAWELNARGIAAADARHAGLYDFLGQRYRVTYTVEGRVPLSEARLAWLIEEIPFAARLLTHFQGVRYEARYLDAERRRIAASRTERLRAEGEMLSGSPEEGRLYYFGLGSSELGPWKLRGRGLLQVDFAGQADGQLWYRVNLRVSPTSSAIEKVMRLDVFQRVVQQEIKTVLEDMTEATRKLEKDGGRSLLKSPGWSAEEKAKIAALLALR